MESNEEKKCERITNKGEIIELLISDHSRFFSKPDHG
jgi:hypothetical protein